MIPVNLALRALPLLNKGSKVIKKTPKKGAGGLSTLMAAAPLINLVSSVAKATTGIASGVAKSMGRAVSGTEKEAERRANADNGDTTPAINTKGAPVNFEEESPVSDMFGGLDLAKVKSTLDDEGPMGPPEPEAPTVYKRMIQVLKTMSETLLRMEATMKMLLAIEYERVKGMVAQSTAENITSAQTDDDDDDDKKKKGFLKKTASIIGSGWKKAKDSPTWLKMLGLAGLLGSIKLWKEDLETAVAKILEWLTKTYEYFTAEDFSFAKIADDFKNKFMPKIYSVVDNILGSVWEYIKASIFGASGSLRIQQEAGDASVSKKSMTTLTDKAIAGGDKLSDMKFHEGAFGIIHLSGADTLESSEVRKLHSSIKDHMGVMNEISKQSGGRIQWDTFPGYNFGEGFSLKNFDDAWKTHPVSSYINANPVIDGVPYESWEVLKTINLDAMAGITKGMGEDRANKIRNVLARKTEAFQSNKSQDSLHEEYLALEPELLPKLTTGDSIITNGTSDSGQKLKDAEKQTPPTGVNAPFMDASTNDNSSTTNVTQNATVSLNGTNEYPIAAGLNEVTGTNYMFGYRTS